MMDPRFKLKIDSDAIWDRLRSAAIVAATPRETEKVFDSQFVAHFCCDAQLGYIHRADMFFFSLKQSQQEDNIQSLGQSQEVEEKQQEEVENYVSP